mmetsp:Transcript_16552/g.31360  ORF Transcript_16552/g.31360 Transcript_16552/m.31360 type:complete len:453 (+) Transcript_16552:82-1440(+)
MQINSCVEQQYVYSDLNIVESRINEAENAFALCDFEGSLSLAKEILTNDRMSCFECSNDQISVENLPVMQLHIPKVVSLDNNVEQCTPMEEGLVVTNDSTFFVVNVIMNFQASPSPSSCIRERACGILIQSSYELWKRRNGSKVDKELCLDVCLFEKSFNTLGKFGDGDVSCESLISSQCPVMITFELVLLYIQFCHSIGIHKPSLVTSLCVLVMLISLESDSFPNMEIIHGEDERDGFYDSCCNYSYEFLSIILLRTIPYIKQIRLVESIVDAIFSLVIKKRNGEGNDFLKRVDDEIIPVWDNLILTSNIHQSSIYVMCRNVEAILISGEESLPKFFWEALRDSLLDAKELLIDPKTNSTMNSVEDFKPNASTCDEKRKSSRDTINVEMDLDSLDKKNEHEGIANLFHRFTEPLWESDDRWINRGKIVLACLFSYSIWKQRNRVWMGRKIK